MAKKFISIALSLCLLISCFSVISVSAAETDKTATGDKRILFTNNLNWGSVFLYSWEGEGGDGHQNSDWPGVMMENVGDNGMGSINFSGSFPDGWNIIFNNGGDRQTVDIPYDGSATGYWLDGSQTDGKFNANAWYDGGSDDPDPWVDPDPWTDPDPYQPVSGSYTAYLDPGTASGAGDWYAYTWEGSSNSWISGTNDGSKLRFDGLAGNVIFASSSGYPDESWSNVSMQTEDLYTEDGKTYVISGTVESVDGMTGEPKTKYAGSWSDGSSYTPDPWTDPDPTPWVNPDPTPATQPVVTPQTQPTTAPAKKTVLKANIMLNGETVKTETIKKSEFTVSFNMKSSEPMVDAQATLTYDNTKFKLTSWAFPIVDVSVIDNLNATYNTACFNFTSPVRPYNFSSGGVLVAATFKVLKNDGTGNINLQIEELDSDNSAFVSNSVVASSGVSVINSMKKVTVTQTGAAINTDSSSGSGSKTVKTKKTNTLKVTAKKKSVKAKMLKSKKQTVKVLTIKKAKGKVKVAVVKKGTAKKLLKKLKVTSKGKLTIKKGKYKKGTYKVRLKVTAAGNSYYKSKKITKTVKIKIK